MVNATTKVSLSLLPIHLDNSSSPPRYLISPPYAVVYGKPSAQLADRLETEEKARIALQVEKLGQDGLAQVAKELEVAQAHNDRPIPSAYLTAFPLPDVAGISWIPVQTARNWGHSTQEGGPTSGNNELARHIAQDPSELPLFVQYDHVKVPMFPCIHVK